MPRTLVVGHHAHESDANPLPLDDDIRGQLRESACIAAQIGADDLEGHAVDHAAEESLPEVEFMVSERRHVVAEAVHQGDHGHSGRRGLVDIGVSGPAVAGIDEDDLLQRIAAGRDGCSQTREVLNPGVHVIGRQQHEGRFAGRAGHSSSGQPRLFLSI